MDHERCPHCGADLRGDPIPTEYLEQNLYGAWDGEPRYYRRLIGVEDPRIYDSVLFSECPDCNRRWHRWPRDSSVARGSRALRRRNYGRLTADWASRPRFNDIGRGSVQLNVGNQAK